MFSELQQHMVEVLSQTHEETGLEISALSDQGVL